MPVEDLLRGTKYTISAWVDREGNCPAKEYISQLAEEKNPDAPAILALFERTAFHGITHNEQKFRFLKGSSQGLIEFKARGGTRILGFVVDETKMIVCTHGIPKLKEKRFQREIDKLEQIKESYEFEIFSEGNDYVN